MKKKNIHILKIVNGEIFPAEDEVAFEKHFSLKINGMKAFTLRCTPEALEELVLGRLCTEGIIRERRQVKKLQVYPEQGEIHAALNTKITTFCREGGRTAAMSEQNFFRKSEFRGDRLSVCGTDLALIFRTAEEIFGSGGELFRTTGCAHSCALYTNGKVVCCFEDIGRHNALDKVVGYSLKHNCPRNECIVFTSGRVSEDYVLKLARAGIPAVISRAAVTEAAVKTARSNRIIVYGFVRNGCGNCYSFDK